MNSRCGSPEEVSFSEAEGRFYRSLYPFVAAFAEQDDLRRLLKDAALNERSAARQTVLNMRIDGELLPDVAYMFSDDNSRRLLLETLEVADYIAAMPEMERRNTIAKLKASEYIGDMCPVRIVTPNRNDH